MKIFEYDICNGDKGIIIAENYEEAVRLFNEAYDKVDLENYDECDIDEDKYEYGGVIAEICDYDGTQQLVCTVDACM